MAEQVGPKAFARRIRDTLPQLSEDLPEVPLLVHRVLRKAADGQLKVRWESDQLGDIRDTIERGNRQTQLTITAAGLIVAGMLAGGLLATPLALNPLWLTAWISGTGVLLLGWVLTRR